MTAKEQTEIDYDVKELIDYLVGSRIKSASVLSWTKAELDSAEDGDVFGVRLELDSGHKIEFYSAGDFMNWTIISKSFKTCIDP